MLVLALRWVGSALLLLTLVLMLVRRVSGAMMVHRLVPWGSTTERSYHILPLLCLLVGADRIIRNGDIANKF
jgi:hypothetical protein